MNGISDAPVDLDLYSDEILLEPYGVYAELRAMGDVVRIPRHETWALPTYAGVRKALENWEAFSSAEGVGLEKRYNDFFVGTMLASDPPDHDVLRRVLSDRIGPRALRLISDDVEARADQLVGEVLERGHFDAVDDLAKTFPVSVVADLIGLPDEGRDRLLEWADATFNAFGPDNERAQAAGPAFEEVFEYIASVATPERLAPGSMGLTVYEAAERGDIREDQILPLMLAYLLPAMDTTVNAIANSIWLFAQHPDQWQSCLDEPSRIKRAFEEVMRLESPVQIFTRTARRGATVGDQEIPEGDRVMVMFASANRDVKRWDEPARFDIDREVGEHLGFGYGVHGCPGQGLARLEAKSILGSLAKRDAHLQLTREPERHLNNVIRGFANMPVRVS